MLQRQTIALLIPARNEAGAIAHVLAGTPAYVDRVIVIDNGSMDATARIARRLGAEVAYEPRPGYGRACLCGLARLKGSPPDIVAFADADGADDLSFVDQLLEPLLAGQADFVLTRRMPAAPGALSLQQRFGNRLATRLMRSVWGTRYQDLGPMRAIRWQTLAGLGMQDPNYGWTVEMQIRAVRCNCRMQEVPIPYRPRIAGRSQVSGTIQGILWAGTKILWVIFREAMDTFIRRRQRPPIRR